MESIGLYLLQSAVWLTGFSIIYLLFLRNERFFVLNRVFLLSGIFISLTFPLLNVHYNVELPSSNINLSALSDPVTTLSTTSPDRSYAYYINIILCCFYVAGFVLFASKAILQTARLCIKIKKTKFNEWGPARLIRTSDYKTPFSFFTYVFINPSVNDHETEEIMHHELVHINQKHWFDLLLIELVCLFQWVNPFAWIYTRYIRLNHEYLADETALRRTSDPAIYRATLLNQMFSTQIFSLSNSFSYSLNKKRFEMMKKITYSPWRKMRILIILPVVAVIMYSFAKPEYTYTNPDGNTFENVFQVPAPIAQTVISEANNIATPEKSIAYQTVDQPTLVPQPVNKDIKGIVVQDDGKPLDGATVVIKGTSLGTSTDANGNFKLTGIPDDGSLVISFIGFKTTTLTPDFMKIMTIKMEKQTVNLGKEILIRNPDSININKTDRINGTMEKPSTVVVEGIQIRNIETKVAPGFYVVDDVITSDISNLDPNSIESVQVIKGQSAIDMYGERAKDGVAIIKTKKSNLQSNEESRSNVSELSAAGQNPPLTFIVIEAMPQFPGGNDAMRQWIARNIKYPEQAVKKNISGIVSVNFNVTSLGKVTDVKILKFVHPLLDAEAVRVIRSMPQWSPGSQNGKPVDVNLSVTVSFML